MRKLLDELEATYKEGNILIVTHGGTTADLLRELFGEKDIDHLTDQQTGARYIEILECSVTVVEKNSSDYKLLKVGDISHLASPLI